MQMKLSHSFYTEINIHKLPQLSKGKGQKFKVYIHWFWKAKGGKKKNFKCHNTVYLFI